MSTTKKGVIGILTGGGDVPGLNPAIRGVVYRAEQEGYEVLGFRRGWAGLLNYDLDKSPAENEACVIRLTRDRVRTIDRAATHATKIRAPRSMLCSSRVPASTNSSFIRRSASACAATISIGSQAFQRFQTAQSISPVSTSKGSATPAGRPASGE